MIPPDGARCFDCLFFERAQGVTPSTIAPCYASPPTVLGVNDKSGLAVTRRPNVSGKDQPCRFFHPRDFGGPAVTVSGDPMAAANAVAAALKDHLFPPSL